jgi:hypothetical protein
MHVLADGTLTIRMSPHTERKKRKLHGFEFSTFSPFPSVQIPMSEIPVSE